MNTSGSRQVGKRDRCEDVEIEDLESRIEDLQQERVTIRG